VLDLVGIETLLRRADGRSPSLPHPWPDAGYRGEDEGAEEVGGGAYAVFLDRPAKEDELRDYERLCASGEALV